MKSSSLNNYLSGNAFHSQGILAGILNPGQAIGGKKLRPNWVTFHLLFRSSQKERPDARNILWRRDMDGRFNP